MRHITIVNDRFWLESFIAYEFDLTGSHNGCELLSVISLYVQKYGGFPVIYKMKKRFDVQDY